MKRLRLLSTISLCAVAIASCARETVVEPTAVTGAVALIIAGGDAQVGVVGQELPTPLKVLAQDQKGHPLRGFLVNFRVVTGGGRMYAGASLTDKDGIAQDYWTLGPALFTEQLVEVVAVDPTTGAKQNFGSFSARGASTAGAQLSMAPTTANLGTAAVGSAGPTTSFVVTNTGATTTGTITAALSGANAGDFEIETNACAGATLTLGQSCAITARLTPHVGGSLAATLSVSAAPGGTATAALTGSGIAMAQLQLTPSTAAFGSVPMFPPTPIILDFTLRNTGVSPSGVIALAITGSHAAAFSIVSNACGVTPLAPAGTCVVSVRFQSLGVFPQTATLAATASPGGTVNSTLTGTGLSSSWLNFSPPSPNFGLVTVGQATGSLPVQIMNVGPPTGPFTVGIVGTHKADFALGTGANSCVGIPSLGTGQTCLAYVRFAPSALGPRTASLQVVSAQGSGAATLTGTGVSGAAAISINPTSVNYGSSTVGVPTAVQVLTVTNNGSGSTGALAVALTGANAPDFQLVTDACSNAVLAPAATCSVAARFNPTATGARTATLTVSGGGTASANLAGTGVVVSSLSISPASWSIGGVTVGSIVTQRFTVSNTGGVPSGALALLLAGSTRDITLENDNCSAVVLPVAGSCTVDVRYAPTVTGGISASLQASATPGGTATAGITGGANSGPNIRVTPNPGDFGAITLGSSRTLLFTVASVGNVPFNAQFGGLTGVGFAVTGNSCIGGVLIPGQSCTISLLFTPPGIGAFAGSLTVLWFAGPPVNVPLTGVGIP